MELSKRSNAKLEEANEEELRQNKAIGKLTPQEQSSERNLPGIIVP